MAKTVGRIVAIGALAFGFSSFAANRAPVQEPAEKKVVKLDKEEMKKITAGKITKTNGGGNTPNGKANGIDYTNPAGNAPGGWNK